VCNIISVYLGVSISIDKLFSQAQSDIKYGVTNLKSLVLLTIKKNSIIIGLSGIDEQ